MTAGNKYLSQVAGVITEVASTQTSSGAPDAAKIPALDSTGKLAVTMMPVGVVPEVKSCVTSENLSAGDIVNIYDVSGTSTARKADCSNGRQAVGFVLSAVTSPAAATVYLESTITGLSALTAGTVMYLSTGGALSATAPSTTGYISQQVGIAISTTEVSFKPQQTITLA